MSLRGLFRRKTLKEHDLPFNMIDNDIHALVTHTAIDNGSHVVVMVVDEEEIANFSVGKKVRIPKTEIPMPQIPQMPPNVMQPQTIQPSQNQPIQPNIQVPATAIEDMMRQYDVKPKEPEKKTIWMPSDLHNRVENLFNCGVNDPIIMAKSIFGDEYHDDQFIAVVERIKTITDMEEKTEKEESPKEATPKVEDTPVVMNAKDNFSEFDQEMRKKGKVRKKCSKCDKRQYGDANQIKFVCDKCKETD